MPKLYNYQPKGGLVKIDPAKLRYWRDVRMFTREELAEDCRVSWQAVKSWELGVRCPEAGHFRNLIRALGINAEDLMLEGYRYRKTADDEQE